MGIYNQLGKVPMVLITTAGVFAVKAFLFDNGLLDEMSAVYNSRSPTLPESSIPLQTSFTGIKQLDEQLAMFTNFFWPMLNGKNPASSLQTVHFFGQAVAAWLIMLVESFRVGNAWKPVSFVTIWFLLVENVGAMIFIPLWCLFYLTTSQTMSADAPPNIRRTGLLVHPTELAVIPWSVLIGLGVPMALIFTLPPAPATPQWQGSQFWIAVRQFHPVLTSLVHLGLSVFSHSSSPVYESPAQRNHSVAQALRRIYAIAAFLATSTHIATLGLSLATVVFPKIIASPYSTMLHPAAVWQPFEFWKAGASYKLEIPVEAARFLQWDEIITTIAVLVWAFFANRAALAPEKEASGVWTALARSALLTVAGGPVTAAIALIQERDDVILDSIESVGGAKKDQ